MKAFFVLSWRGEPSFRIKKIKKKFRDSFVLQFIGVNFTYKILYINELKGLLMFLKFNGLFFLLRYIYNFVSK